MSSDAMTLAQRIEAVFRHHRCNGRCTLTTLTGVQDTVRAVLPCHILLTELAALAPTPSREALQLIFKKHKLCWEGPHKCDHSLVFDDIMAWTTGAAGEPKEEAPAMPSAPIRYLPQHPVCMTCGHCIGCDRCSAPRPARS